MGLGDSAWVNREWVGFFCSFVRGHGMEDRVSERRFCAACIFHIALMALMYMHDWIAFAVHKIPFHKPCITSWQALWIPRGVWTGVNIVRFHPNPDGLLLSSRLESCGHRSQEFQSPTLVPYLEIISSCRPHILCSSPLKTESQHP